MEAGKCGVHKGERYCPTPFWKHLSLKAVISCSRVQSSTGAGRPKGSFDDFPGGAVCVHKHINHSVHKCYCRSVDIHHHLLEFGLGGASLNGCQTSRRAHKDPKTQGCLIVFKRTKTWVIKWMNGSLLTFSRCLSNVGHVCALQQSAWRQCWPKPIAPQHRTSLHCGGSEVETQEQFSPGQVTSLSY